MHPKKIYVLVGEASGDLHASNLIKELRKLHPNITVQGWGGNLMQQQGVTILKPYSELAFMGFVEVVKNLNTIRKNFAVCKQQITAFAPDVLLLVDYPGFNLRMAKWAKLQGYKTIYYISPQIWAWKESRIHDIKKYVDVMMCILPFEKNFYQKHNYPVHYVGHPLVKVVNDYKATSTTTNKQHTIVLLPGSRKQEIEVQLPLMLNVTTLLPQHNYVVAMAPSIQVTYYNTLLQGYSNVKAQKGDTYSLLCNAKAALVTSGTATLETALFKVPQIVCYKGNAISYAIAKRLLKIKYISLVNLILNKPAITELIQKECTPIIIANKLTQLLQPQANLLKDYNELEQLLTQGGNASVNAAKLLLKQL